MKVNISSLKTLLTSFSPLCSRYEYMWCDGHHYKKPTALPAPQYITLLMEWVESQINDETIFPIKVGGVTDQRRNHLSYQSWWSHRSTTIPSFLSKLVESQINNETIFPIKVGGVSDQRRNHLSYQSWWSHRSTTKPSFLSKLVESQINDETIFPIKVGGVTDQRRNHLSYQSWWSHRSTTKPSFLSKLVRWLVFRLVLHCWTLE
ncbi:hypothetical protein DPMN_118883 [Dreissena polymorpha]|uniref:Uncharacterized protein n=1 Tax=Dreissena polymorpha TaxID=45954 RepID=A0A9D4GLI2_DREPO|nr:hypothetical protein DPMN_118883 [Dreissena polymorpha]